MTQLDSNDKILGFAIEQEEKAYLYYLELAQKATNKATQVLFKEFAQEEVRHKEKLIEIKKGQHMELLGKRSIDLKISDNLKKIEAHDGMSYQDALIFAMQLEKKAYQMYISLAASCDDQDMKRSLLAMAREEANHKMVFELEYDEVFLAED